MKVSVVIPAFNVGKYISKCLDSVLGQTHKDLEIICVDDCSTDKTYSILQSYKEKHTSIILLRNDENKGAPYSRNRGLDIATGDYIQFLDSDDELLPLKIENQVNLIENLSSKPDFVIGNYRWNLDGKTINSISFTKNVWVDLISGSLGNTCSNLWKKTALDAVSGWSVLSKSSQETDLMFRLLKNNCTYLYDDNSLTIINHRNIGSISRIDRPANTERFIEVRIKIAEYLNGSQLMTKQIEAEYYKVLFNGIRLLFTFDPIRAKKYFKNELPESFPLESECNTSFFYKILFRFFGFYYTEKLIGILKRS